MNSLTFVLSKTNTLQSMKKTFLALAIVLSGTTFAQELPMPSPTATLQQRIGLTDFTIVYSRPGAKDRQVLETWFLIMKCGVPVPMAIQPFNSIRT